MSDIDRPTAVRRLVEAGLMQHEEAGLYGSKGTGAQFDVADFTSAFPDILQVDIEDLAAGGFQITVYSEASVSTSEVTPDVFVTATLPTTTAALIAAIEGHYKGAALAKSDLDEIASLLDSIV